MESLSSSASGILSPAATLSMEVSYPYHSHLIGRSGQNVNRVMDESGTRIHFPDRNRIVGEYKCNNVIIRGPMANIEQARTRIRMDIPVEIIIDCSNERIASIGQVSLESFFSTTYDVLLRFYPKIDGLNCQVNIRGQHHRIQRLKEAVTFFGRMTQTQLESMGMKIETSFDHVWLIHDHIDKIAAETGTGIRIPDISNLKEMPKKYCIWIRGPSVDSVYTASTFLTGLLPMQLMVQLSSDRINPCLLTEAQEMDVLFHVERSALGSLLTVRLTSYELNARNLYEMLRRCLDLPVSHAVVPNLPPIWLHRADLVRNTFLPTTKKLLQELSFVQVQRGTSPPLQLNGIVVGTPQSPISTADCSLSSASVSSPCASNESCIPASLTAARFDPNSSRHLSDFLGTVGLSHYSDLFLRNEIDMAMFTTLKDEDLISIGVTSFGARKILLNAIQELRM
ncbi:protein bicaudal C homolog 1-like [Daphnia pulex]|uniref:protein bicaudal C homolog 1-like n=1 Tax=Daphnia pulex TaxID=6669 RepID=UPI001EDF3EB7|nr:protein bicaudal C homolog 1-like [Daphnia pulex]